MCTATWLSRPDGFDLFFNRDESKLRLPARPPEALLEQGVRVLAPIDGNAGGTWIAVNEFGLALCLVNARASSPESGEPDSGGRTPSRGWLVLQLAPAATCRRVAEALRGIDLAPFWAFRLAVFGPGVEPELWRWTGARLQQERVSMPLVSSSLGDDQAFAVRSRLLSEFSGAALAHAGIDAAVLEAFHRSHAPARGPWSPCMHREDASTQSATHVKVSTARVEMRYAAGPPCEASFGSALGIERVGVLESPVG